MRSLWRARDVAIALVAAGSLVAASACAGLPATSGVQAGRAVESGQDDEPLVVEPLTASAFQDPREIAIGFVRAQMSTHDNHAAARTFLTGAATSMWKPGSAVTVFSGESDITASRPDMNTVRLSVPVVAAIDAGGHLVRRPSPQRRELEFTLRRTSDGWRLGGVPADLGVWISDADVPRLFRQADVYYAPAHGRTLIADPRWLPRQGMATALARAALSPPPAWLRPAVRQDTPGGSRLAVDAVPVKDGVAQVDLTKGAAASDNPARTALWAAMTATVVQAPDVRSLELTVASSRLEAENLPAVVSDVSDLGYAQPAQGLDAVISRSGSYLAWTHALASDAVSGTDKKVGKGRATLPAVPSSWSLLAAGQGGRQIAAVSKDRTSVRRWLNGTDVTVDSLGTDLVRPAFDAGGWLWCAGRAFSNAQGPADPGAGDVGTARGSIWALDTRSGTANAQPARVTASWLGGSRITALSVAPEGERLALVLDDGRSTRAVVAAVQRDARGRPTALGPAHPVAGGVRDLRDIAWADATSLAVLGVVDGTLQPAVQPLDDAVLPLGPVRSAEAIASALGGENGLFVRTSGDSVVTRLGSSWNSFLTHGDIVVPTP